MKQQELLPCDAWAGKLAALHPEDLPIEERAELARHVQTCAACTAALADYRSMDAAIRALPAVEPLPALPLALRQVFGEEETDGAPIPMPGIRHRPFKPPLPRIRPLHGFG
jgi:anti-sigma factor RsiW